MSIVADGSPFVLLVSIEQDEVLAKLFKDVIIPPQVQAKLSSQRKGQAPQRKAFPGGPAVDQTLTS